MADDPFLRVEINNERSVELLDLTMSLMALGQLYEQFAAEHGADPIPGNVKLYIRELRSGSVIADLQPMLEQTSFVIEHREILAGFLGSFNDLVNGFILDRWLRDGDAPSRRDAERLNQVFEPVAKDGGSQLILQVQGDVHMHEHRYEYDSPQANVLQNKVRKFLGPSLPREVRFHQEPLYLVQVRDDPKGKAGDRGAIEKFSERPVPLKFMNEIAKRAVLELEEHPFKMVFLVDGEVGYVKDKPAVYKITHVHDHFPRPDV